MIHPHAIVDPRAELDPSVTVGPFTTIGAGVKIAAGTVIGSHVVIKGPSEIGRNNRIYQFASVGEDTPDLKYQGEPTRLIMGDNNVVREGVTIHRGTVQDRSETVIGSDNLLMAYVHIGHDCVVGNHTILVNNASISGHVVVDDWAILSGYALVHQFVQIGAHAFVGPGSFLYHDVPAFVTATGSPAQPRTINREGMKRRGFSSEQIAQVNRAYKILYRRGLTAEQALVELQGLGDDSAVGLFHASVARSRRGIIR